MKKLLVLLAAFAFSTAAVSAQTTPVKAAHKQHQKGSKSAKTPEQRADHAAQSLARKVGLSAAQTEQVRQLNLARFQELQAKRAQVATAADKKQRHQALKASKDRYEAQLKQILSAEQYTKYAQLQAEKQAKHKGRQEQRKAKS
ncbi:hypothetical protein HNQ93_001293 [Hymenobacter luteus]|uniref:DUF4890 domain-containing protein n=2 Tax=Hymenobacter TaxID=89966 RepID=A0A7W9WC94_9BACT|nr:MULTISPECIES: hypothetical protein [Hymenobacter]MBB4601346.1 hypothetical protein [Hymenobacter latericoloratus]MBB6058447.1 hypothetical protein [Hymenobacter luteus]